MHEHVINKGAKNLALVGSSLQSDLVKTVAKQPGVLKKIQAAKGLLEGYRWLLAKVLSETQLAGFVLGADFVIQQLPSEVRDELSELIDLEDAFASRAPDVPKRGKRSVEGVDSPLDQGAPEKAKDRLHERKAVSKREFARIKQEAAAKSQAIVKDLEKDVLSRVRDAARQQKDEDHDSGQFSKNLRDSLKTSKSGKGESKVAARYAVTTGGALGQKSVLKHGPVAKIFPYRRYVHIADNRVRSEHRFLGHFGYDGLGIYRADDPFWDVWSTPADYGCRCDSPVLTIKQAARLGVQEAEEWLRTGLEPEPTWFLDRVPFAPSEDYERPSRPLPRRSA